MVRVKGASLRQDWVADEDIGIVCSVVVADERFRRGRGNNVTYLLLLLLLLLIVVSLLIFLFRRRRQGITNRIIFYLILMTERTGNHVGFEYGSPGAIDVELKDEVVAIGASITDEVEGGVEALTAGDCATDRLETLKRLVINSLIS